MKKPAVQSSSTLSVKQSGNPNETEAFDTSDELLDDLVKNATLTASRDALKQRKIARYGAQRRSCTVFFFQIYSTMIIICHSFCAFFSTTNTSFGFK